MLRHQWWFLALFFFFLSGCVSVSLNKGDVRRSENYRWTPPPAPFSNHEASGIDHAWKNPKTGSIISIVTECSESFDPTLTTLRDDIVRGLAPVQIESEKTYQFQAREALRSQVRGQVDGVPSVVDLVVFKKNGCSYILSLVGTTKTLGREISGAGHEDVKLFDQFLTGLRVP